MKILVDFGATRIKAVVVQNDLVVQRIEVESPSSKNWKCEKNHFQFPAQEFVKAWEKTVGELTAWNKVKEIRVCTEMHGFIHNDIFYSWKDARVDVGSYDQQDAFLKRTGMKLRTGIPWLTLQAIDTSKNPKVTTITEYILKSNKINRTIAHAMGLTDETGQWDHDLLIQLPEIVGINEPIGRYLGIPVIGGIGDFQSAMLGAGLGDRVDGVINLGTGSQVALTKAEGWGEIRPLAKGRIARVVTHIPSGRALNIVANFVDSIKPDTFWEMWNNLTVDEVRRAPIEYVDMNFFTSAWYYQYNTGFIQLREDFCRVEQIVPAVARSWISQYKSALNYLDHNAKSKTIAVSGGLTKSQWVIPYLEQLIPERSFHRVNTITGEETLDGLLKL